MENHVSPWSLPGRRQGVLAAALPPDHRVQQVAVDDLAAFVVHVIEGRERFLRERIGIAGDAPTGT